MRIFAGVTHAEGIIIMAHDNSQNDNAATPKQPASKQAKPKEATAKSKPPSKLVSKRATNSANAAPSSIPKANGAWQPRFLAEQPANDERYTLGNEDLNNEDFDAAVDGQEFDEPEEQRQANASDNPRFGHFTALNSTPPTTTPSGAFSGAPSVGGPYLNGKDEMNLAEFPIARLGRNDTRLSIEYKGQITDKLGNVIEQKWIVSGNATFGLPTEFADRVLVALMYITNNEVLKNNTPDRVDGERRVPFTIYRIIKLLGLSRNQRNYAAVEKALQQLVGVTIYSEGAFWDHQQQKRVTTKKGFHILEEFWIKSFDEDDDDHSDDQLFDQHANLTGYVVWGERIWDSFEAGYIKNLDVEFYYGLENTLARRLYRFLDKRMHYQESYQIDIFDLAARMGMKPYPFASHLARKLKPAFDELQARGFLARVDVVKVGDFTRVRFLRNTSTPRFADAPENAIEAPRSDIEAARIQSTTCDGTERSGADFQPSPQCQEVWASVLAEYQLTLPPATYAMLANSQLRHLDENPPGKSPHPATLTATVAVDSRYQEWITRQMARQIKAQLNQHLDHALRVKDLLIISL